MIIRPRDNIAKRQWWPEATYSTCGHFMVFCEIVTVETFYIHGGVDYGKKEGGGELC